MKNIKRIILILVGGLVCGEGVGQSPNWQWAKRVGGSGFEGSTSITTDVNGNSYITGLFYGATVTFGSITLNNIDNTGNTFDIFIAKFDVNGNVLWAKSAGGTEGELAWSITQEVNGNLYLTGYFQSPSLIIGSDTLINVNGNAPSFFIAKYDSQGNALWAKGTSGSSYAEGTSITVDASGNSFVTGWFYPPTITFGSVTLSNAGTAEDIFIVKYNSAGNVIWAQSAGGNYNYDEGMGITVDTIGNLYLTGWFGGPTITFGSTVLTNSNTVTPHGDIFVVKYDTSGNVLWARSAGGNDGDYSSSIVATANGNLYVTGSFKSPVITFGSNTLINADSTGYSGDVFIAKYDSSGNVLWAHSTGGELNDLSSGLTCDANENVYLTGNFFSPDMTFGNTTLINSSIGLTTADIFILKYGTSGNEVWAKSAGCTYVDASWGISMDAYGNSYITGDFEGSSMIFDSIILTNGGAGDIFVAKLDNTTGIQEQHDFSNVLNIFPNPTTGTIQLTFNSNHNAPLKCEIINVLGEKVFEKELLSNQTEQELNLSFLQQGVYFLNLKTGGESYTKKVVKM